jgi:hypothetical protein
MKPKEAKTNFHSPKINNHIFKQVDDLPRFVQVPIGALSQEISLLEQRGYLLFSTHSVAGDGNCLYHAILNSKLFCQIYPGFGKDTNQLRKELSICLTSTENLTFSEKLMAHCPSPRVKDQKSFQKGITEWSIWLKTDKEWGSQSECVLFTKRFGINVVILQQTEYGIPTFGTYYRHRQWFEIENKSFNDNMYEKKNKVGPNDLCLVTSAGQSQSMPQNS